MKTTSSTKNKEFYYRIVYEDCEKCGAGKEVLYKYNDYQNNGKREAIGWFCVICGNKKKPPKIELPRVEKKIIVCQKCFKRVETGIFNPPRCWVCRHEERKGKNNFVKFNRFPVRMSPR